MTTKKSSRAEVGAMELAVGENLRILRQQSNYSLRGLEAKLAEQGCRLSFAAIGNIENGKRRLLVDELLALADVFDVAMIELLIHPTTRGSGPKDEEAQAFKDHHTGLWPKRYPKPLRTSDQVQEVAAFWYANSHPMRTGRRDTKQRAIATQLQMVKDELQTQQQEWEQIREQDQLTNTPASQRILNLRDSLRSAFGNPSRTLEPFQDELGTEAWAEVQRLENETLDLLAVVSHRYSQCPDSDLIGTK